VSSPDWKSKIGRNRLYSVDFQDRDDVVLWDVLEIEKEQLLKVVFISKKSTHSQGVRLAIDAGVGILEVNGIKSKEIHLWFETAPKEIMVRCKSEEGLISVYNIFQQRHFPESQMFGSGMLVEQDGNKTTYRCNDVTVENVNFDSVVFSIENMNSSAKP